MSLDPNIEIEVRLRRPHKKQQEIIVSPAKRKVVRAGRRGGKTLLMALIAVMSFLEGYRVLYAAPTDFQVETFWSEVKDALWDAIEGGVLIKNETKRFIDRPGPRQSARIKAKSAYDAETLRGGWADRLILDEYQNMNPSAWEEVGAPMLLDNGGDAYFIYTTRQGARGDHARKLFKKAEIRYQEAIEAGEVPRWEAFSFSSLDNPFLNQEALDDIVDDMSNIAYRMEILAEEVDEHPGALWRRAMLEQSRVFEAPPMDTIVVGVDPPGAETGECGIVVAGSATVDGETHAFVLDDLSMAGLPQAWGGASVDAYDTHEADMLVAETNFGGDMVANTMRTVAGGNFIPIGEVRASRGKKIRAGPVSSLYERGRVHHVGAFPLLEDEMCNWIPGGRMPSPNRLDAVVWAVWKLLLSHRNYGTAKAVPYV